MAIEVFNRYETKYMIPEELYRSIRPLLEEHMEPDSHSRNGEFYTICNIYYDTPDHAIIRRSLEKPVYKEKLRLRSYGMSGPGDMVYLEIKKKFNGCVNKRRTAMPLEEAYHYLETKQKPSAVYPVNGQILNEIDYMVQRYSILRPVLFLSYDRNAMFGTEDRNFRVTFDTNIRTRREQVNLHSGDHGELLLPGGQWIMEVKTRDTVPLWFARLLSQYDIYPVPFSKYGKEHEKYIRQDQKPGLQCKADGEHARLYA